MAYMGVNSLPPWELPTADTTTTANSSVTKKPKKRRFNGSRHSSLPKVPKPTRHTDQSACPGIPERRLAAKDSKENSFLPQRRVAAATNTGLQFSSVFATPASRKLSTERNFVQSDLPTTQDPACLATDSNTGQSEMLSSAFWTPASLTYRKQNDPCPTIASKNRELQFSSVFTTPASLKYSAMSSFKCSGPLEITQNNDCSITIDIHGKASAKPFVPNRETNAPSPFPKRRREPSTKKVSTKPVYVSDDMPAMIQAVTQTTHLFVTKLYKMKNIEGNPRKYATINYAKETWEKKNSSH